MSHLLVINPARVDAANLSGWSHRQAVRAVVFNSEGKIGLLHARRRGYYKLPGGGVEAGEDVKAALDREVEEELGVGIEVGREIGSIVEYRSKWKLRQQSHCFLARVASQRSVNFTAHERSLGFEITWVEPEEGLKLLDLKQTSDYEGQFIEKRDHKFLSRALDTLSDKGLQHGAGRSYNTSRYAND